MTRLSIRWRLTLWYGAALAIALVCFCMLILVLARQQSLSHTDAALQEELQELVLEVRLAGQMDELKSQLDARFSQHDVYRFRVTGSSGKRVFASSGLTPLREPVPQVDAAEPAPRFQTIRPEGEGAFRVASIIAHGRLGTFTVEAVASLAPLHAEIRSLGTIMLFLLPLALVSASMGGYWLAGRALAPVSQIASVANAITIDRLDSRIEILNPHDEIGRLASTLNALIARLERAVNEIQRFTADASHELRTPLAALRSEAEAALRSRRSPEQYEDALRVVVDEATRLSRLADQLLVLTRQDAGAFGSRRESVRLDALLLDVVEQLRTTAEKDRVTIQCSDVQPGEIDGDDIRLSQALFNVIENAVKYTPADGRVAVCCRVSKGSALIEVNDTGIGIEAEHLPHVFDRFYRAEPSRNCAVGGTGLGLSIAHAAVVAHRGTIDIQSQPRVGTTVTIRFPEATAVRDSEHPTGRLAPVLSKLRSTSNR